MYPAGEAIAESIETTSEHIHVNICASTGSYTNIQMLSEGQIDLGLVSGDAAYAAFHGTHEFSAAPPDRASDDRGCILQHFQLDGPELLFSVLRS